MRGPQRWELLALLLFGLGLAALLWLYVGDVLASMLWHRMALLDARWEAEIMQSRDPAWQPFWAGVTRLGGPGFLPWLVALLTAACFAARRFFEGILLMWGTTVLTILVQLVKAATDRARPATAVDALSPAFPSAHVSLSFLVYGLLALYILAPNGVRRSLRVSLVSALVALVAAISWSRLALGAQWPSDVLGAGLLSGLWLGLLGAAWRGYRRRHPPRALVGAERIWSRVALGSLGIAGLAVLGSVLAG